MACAVVPPGPPSNVLGNRGTRCTSGGVAPPAPCLGNGGFVAACALLQRWGWLGVRRCPTGPPSNVFGNRGTRCTPGGGCAPCTLLGGRGFCFGLRPPSAVGLAWRAPLSHLAHPPTFLETGGHAVPPTGAAPPAPRLGDGGFVLACALLQRWGWLGVRRCPTGPPSDVFGNRGTPPVRPAGAAPAARCLGNGGSVAFSPSAECGGRDKMRLLDGWFCCGLRRPSAGGLAWRAPLSHRPTLQRF